VAVETDGSPASSSGAVGITKFTHTFYITACYKMTGASFEWPINPNQTEQLKVRIQVDRWNEELVRADSGPAFSVTLFG
jgi:hypothetical protein